MRLLIYFLNPENHFKKTNLEDVTGPINRTNLSFRRRKMILINKLYLFNVTSANIGHGCNANAGVHE